MTPEEYMREHPTADLEDKIERLTQEVFSRREQRITELEAENTRLREALRKSDPWTVRNHRSVCVFCGETNYGSASTHKKDCVWAEIQYPADAG